MTCLDLCHGGIIRVHNLFDKVARAAVLIDELRHGEGLAVRAHLDISVASKLGGFLQRAGVLDLDQYLSSEGNIRVALVRVVDHKLSFQDLVRRIQRVTH